MASAAEGQAGASSLGSAMDTEPVPPSSDSKGTGRTDVTIEKPFVYGSAAFFLGKPKAGEGNQHSHRWTVYVRGLQSEDLSTFIKSVTFKLHDSFEQATRVFEKPPYEVTETGWGEFSIMITIAFRDPAEKPVSVHHMLKLFPANKSAQVVGKPVMSEKYDEFVFHHPTEALRALLMKKTDAKVANKDIEPFYTNEAFVRDERRHLTKLGNAKKNVNKQMDTLRQKLFLLDEEIIQLEKLARQG